MEKEEMPGVEVVMSGKRFNSVKLGGKKRKNHNNSHKPCLETQGRSRPNI